MIGFQGHSINYSTLSKDSDGGNYQNTPIKPSYVGKFKHGNKTSFLQKGHMGPLVDFLTKD